jgi:hypothetical protein
MDTDKEITALSAERLAFSIILGSVLSKLATDRTQMRATALVILLCMSSGVVSAQTTEQCRPTQRAGDLLACYNRTAPPHTLGKPKTSKASTSPRPNKPAVSEAPIAADKSAASKAPTDQRAQYIDVLAVENSKIDAKMKTICRGC